MFTVTLPSALPVRAARVASRRPASVRAQAISSSSSSKTTVTTTVSSDAALSKVEIKWGKTDTAAKTAVYEYDNLYRSGLPDEAVKVAYDGMQGALAYWIRQQQIVAEEATAAVIMEKLRQQRELLAIEFNKEKEAALAAQKAELEGKFQSELNGLKAKYEGELNNLKAAHAAETKDLKAEIERLKALLAQAKADYDNLKAKFDSELAAMSAKFAAREKELLDEIERLKAAVGLMLKAANAKYAEAAKQLEAALMLPIGQAVQRFKEIIDELFVFQKEALADNEKALANILKGNK